MRKDTIRKSGFKHYRSYCGLLFQCADGQVAADDDEDYNEVEEHDRDRFADQLWAIGSFARLIPDHSVPLLTM